MFHHKRWFTVKDVYRPLKKFFVDISLFSGTRKKKGL